MDQAPDLIRVSRNLERMADLTTNIAEQVIFMAEARVVKHQGVHEQTPGEESTRSILTQHPCRKSS
ncbi:MAG: hypothetical protein KF749_05025 [Bacteroidetes bacterium]|nr:hypothetical protein [Bacteroidota bacterium]MCW5896501.1 hypothetical protein [Bacteroidota bacterium]